MLLTEIRNRIGYIILNRPEKKNALNYTFIAELKMALNNFASTPEVKVVVIKSSGDSFCAGADLEYLLSLKNNSYQDNLKDTQHIAELFDTIYHFPKLTISQVEGYAIAGGCGIATATDFCYATPQAKFGYSEVKIGFVPALVSVYLVRRIGEAKAKEFLLTGNIYSAEESLNLGVVNKILDKENIDEFIYTTAVKLAETTSSDSITATKQLLQKLYGASWDESFKWATEANTAMRETDDFKKGINSFVNKEKLIW